MFEQRLAYDRLVYYRRFKKYRQAKICHFLIFTGTADMNIVVSLAPIGRGTLRESVDTLCDYQKCYLRTLSYHLPALLTPFIRLVKKEVGGETGINDIAVRNHFIITVFITLGRSVKRFVFHYCRAVYIVLCVTSVDVTVFTSVADFPTTVPRIPSIVHNFKLR